MKMLNNGYENSVILKKDPIRMTAVIRTFFAHIVSVLLVPLLIPTYLFCIILFYFPHLSDAIGQKDKLIVLSVVFLGTSILPLSMVFILYKLKMITTISLNKREDRFIPQLFACACYLFISIFLISRMGATNVLSLAMIANAVSLVGITIITRYWKISTHASGAMGLFSIASVLYFKYPSETFLIPYLIVLFLTVSVCFARLYLKAHTLSQIFGGCLLGALIGVVVFCFLA